MTLDEEFKSWVNWLQSPNALRDMNHVEESFTWRDHFYCKLKAIRVRETGNYSVNITVEVSFMYITSSDSESTLKKKIEYSLLQGSGNVYSLLSHHPFKMTASVRFI